MMENLIRAPVVDRPTDEDPRNHGSIKFGMKLELELKIKSPVLYSKEEEFKV